MRLGRANDLILYICIFIAFRWLVAIPKLVETISLHPVVIPIVAFFAMVALMFIQLKIVTSYASMNLQFRTSGIIALILTVMLITLILITRKYKMLMPLLHSSTMEAIRDLILMLCAISLGYIISFIIREPNIIIPVALFAAIADLWGVTSGPVSQVIEKQPEILDSVAVHMPAPVSGFSPALIGMGDFLFLALFFTVIYRFSLNIKGTFWLAYALLTITVLIVLVVDIAVPALVPMGIAIICANYRYIKLDRQEKLAILYLFIILLIIYAFLNMNVLRSLFA